jgi:outer membrane protein, heavy metal efflux system
LADLAREAVEITKELYNVGQADRPDQLEIEIEAEHAEIKEFAAKTVAKQQAGVAEMNRLKAALGGRAAARKPAPKKRTPAKKPAAHSGHHE